MISLCLLAPLVRHCSIFTQTGIFPETSMLSATYSSTSAIVYWRSTAVSVEHNPSIAVSSFYVGDVGLFIDHITINDKLRPRVTQCRGEHPSRKHHTVSLLFINVITTTVQVHNLNDCTDRVTALLACHIKLLLPCSLKVTPISSSFICFRQKTNAGLSWWITRGVLNNRL